MVSSPIPLPADQPATTDALRLPARRTLNRLAWGLAALGLGWLAQGSLQRSQLWPGLALYALAVGVFVWKFGWYQVPGQAALEEAGERPAASERRRRLGWGVMVIGLAASLLALLMFLAGANSWAWYAYLISLPLFLGGVWLSQPSPARRAAAGERPALLDPWLVLVILVALAFRLYRFDTVPFGTWYDEAVAGLEARRVLQDASFRPVFWEAMNHPAHHLYLFALAMRILGDNILALRAVSVLFGLGTVLVAYLFGRAWGGRRWGVLLALLMATLRWDVNFSRIAMNGLDAPFFEFLTLYFGWRSVRTGWSRPEAAAAGLSLGLGLCFYTGFRLFVVALVAWGLLWLARAGWVQRRYRPVGTEPTTGMDVRRLWSAVGVAALGAWLAVMPVVQFALSDPQTFWNRTQTVSIFTNRENPDLGQALLHNIEKHLLMFNYRGDPNGRHNLPGAPTLEPISAVLFVLGLGLASVRRGWRHRFFVWLWWVGLLGGILSLDFEAPQSLRAIAAMPAVVYFVALSLDTLWCELKWAARIARPRLSLVPALLGLGLIGMGNWNVYFGQQAGDAAVWQSFSAAETLVGQQVAAMGEEPVYYFSPFFYDHPCIRFHAPAGPGSVRKVMPLPDALPAREPGARPVVYFIHPDERWVYDWARQLYPGAEFRNLPEDAHYPTVVYMVRLGTEDVVSLQGLTARYWSGDDDSNAPAASGRAPFVDLRWPAEAPLELPFVAAWDGVLYAPSYGQYTLSLHAPDEVRLSLDGVQITGSRVLTATPLLAQGNHYLNLWARGAPGSVQLFWQPPGQEQSLVPGWVLYRPPVTANGLLGRYFANPDWRGAPALARIDPLLDIYFHLTPLPRPYSVEWSGELEVPQDGLYRLGLRAVDRASLYLDSQLVLETKVADVYTEASLTLSHGLHPLRVTFQDLSGRTRIHLYWMRPGAEREIIPMRYLWPSSASAQAAPTVQPTAQPAEFPPLDLTYLASWGQPGQQAGQFQEPRDLAIIGDTLFVADTGNRRVQAFTLDGRWRTAWSGGTEPFQEPLALEVDREQRLLVLDSLPGWIYRFDASGQFLDRFGGPDLGLYHPRGMAILPGDILAVADTGGGRLVFFNLEGALLGQMGNPGDAPGQLSEPTDVLMDRFGLYYVLEAYSHRLQLLDSWGGSLGLWQIPASIAYDGPHMTWAPDGSLLMTAPEERAILRYTPDGRLLNRWSDASGFPLRKPVGIYLDMTRGRLFVTDTQAHQVHLFQVELP